MGFWSEKTNQKGILPYDRFEVNYRRNTRRGDIR
jgi:hypothetical protein